MDEGGHDRKACQEGEMGRACGRQGFLSQERGKDTCVAGVLVAEKAYEVALLQPSKHVPYSCFILHLLPGHRAVFTEETVKVLVFCCMATDKRG